MSDSLMVLLEVLHGLGGYLVEDDIRDFPWMNVGTKSHPGFIHHGMIGYALQMASLLSGLAYEGEKVAEAVANKSEFQLIMERFESIAYPTPSI